MSRRNCSASQAQNLKYASKVGDRSSNKASRALDLLLQYANISRAGCGDTKRVSAYECLSKVTQIHTYVEQPFI
jgi:hypothetical protein